jgi:hypothetical protein
VSEEADARGGGGAEDGGIEAEEEAVGVHGALQLRLPLLLPIRRGHGHRCLSALAGGVSPHREEAGAIETGWISRSRSGGRRDGDKQTHTTKPARAARVEMGRWVGGCCFVLLGFGLVCPCQRVSKTNQQVGWVSLDGGISNLFL